MSEQEDFINALGAAVDAAVEAANDVSTGDPATHVSAHADGRYTFAKRFKEYVAARDGDTHVIELERNGNVYKITLDDNNRLGLHVLSGVDIQLHQKKLAAYRAFGETMEQRDYTISDDGIDIGMVAR